ncbi:hypothetical protein D6777_01160 [Candidatus Woesearchaeota archaeon]|nr:MAG: hypothetical protein D6777_01160 [Candidatus Woesearchaeota archaeon]
MGFLRNLLLSSVAGLELLTLNPSKATAKPKPPIVKKTDFRLTKKLKHPAFTFPKKEKEKKFTLPTFSGSTFGSFSQLSYLIPKGIELRKDGKLWYNDLNFDVRNEDFFEKLKFYINSGIPLYNTPIDGVGNDILNMHPLSEMNAGDLKIPEWFKVFRLFYNLTDHSFDGKTFTAKGQLIGKSNTFSEAYSAINIKSGQDLIRYEHSVRYSVLIDSSMSITGKFVFGDGLNLGIHSLEKYFGSAFNMDFYLKIIADLTSSESHQFSYRVPHGWNGLGFTRQQYYRSINFENLILNAEASYAQLENLNIADILLNNFGQERTMQGESYFAYVYRKIMKKDYWYYLIAGAYFNKFNLNFQYKYKEQKYTLDLFSNLLTELNDYNLEFNKDRNELKLGYGFVAGLNIGNIFYPYIGSTNFPYDSQLFGGIISTKWFAFDAQLLNNSYKSDSAKFNFEFAIPLTKGTSLDNILRFYQERTTNIISPMSSKFTLEENLRRQAYSKTKGLTLTGRVNLNESLLSILANNNRSYLELGFAGAYEGSLRAFTRIGYRNIGFIINYGNRKNKKTNSEGHYATLGLVGDFKQIFLRIDASIWFSENSGYQHYPSGYIRPKQEKYFLLSVGGVW